MAGVLRGLAVWLRRTSRKYDLDEEGGGVGVEAGFSDSLKVIFGIADCEFRRATSCLNSVSDPPAWCVALRLCFLPPSVSSRCLLEAVDGGVKS